VVVEQQEPAEDYRVNQVTNLLGGMLTSLGGGNDNQEEQQVISGDPITQDPPAVEEPNPFTFGGVPNEPTVTEEPPPFTVLDPDDPDPETPDPLSTDGGGGSSGGGGGSVGGSATDFLENLSYAPFVAPSIIPTAPVNFKNPMDAALDDIISGKPLPRENKNMFTF